MVRGMLLVGATLVVLCGSAAAAPNEKGKGPKVDEEKPGKAGSAKWDYKMFDARGKVVQTGAFFAKDSKIINGKGKQVGTYEDVSETFVKVDVDEGKLVGKIDLRRDKPTTLTWHGDLVRPGGVTYKIAVTFEKMK